MTEIFSPADFASFKSLKQGGFSNKDQDAILAKIVQYLKQIDGFPSEYPLTGRPFPENPTFKDIRSFDDESVLLSESGSAENEDWHKVYNKPSYVLNSFCYYHFGSNTMMNALIGAFRKFEYMPKVILDFGGGCGLTTAHLARALPDTEVHVLNKSGIQLELAKNLADNIDNMFAHEIDDYDDEVPLKADVIVALDVFEHVYKPLDILDKIITSDCKFFVENTPFKTPGLGHFSLFETYGYPCSRRASRNTDRDALRKALQDNISIDEIIALGIVPDISILFNHRLRHHGFHDGVVKLFNSRPKVHISADICEEIDERTKDWSRNTRRLMKNGSLKTDYREKMEVPESLR
jgi:hypothetical protein